MSDSNYHSSSLVVSAGRVSGPMRDILFVCLTILYLYYGTR